MLERVNGTSATVKPRVLNPQDDADQRRGDIKVSTCYGVDPRHRRCVPRDPALRRPGSDATSRLAGAVKAAKYADQDNFIPFILKTGGRVNKAAREWLETAQTSLAVEEGTVPALLALYVY